MGVGGEVVLPLVGDPRHPPGSGTVGAAAPEVGERGRARVADVAGAVDYVDQALAHPGDSGGRKAQRAVELIVEDEEERHGIGTQIQTPSGGIGKAIGGESGHVPRGVPVHGPLTTHQPPPADPVKVAAARALHVRADPKREG